MASNAGSGSTIDLAQINPEGYARLARVRDGVLLYNRFDQYIGRAIGLAGEYCEGRNAMLRQIVQKGDIVVDVGAYIGATTLPMAKAVGPDGAVIAIEAQRISHHLLCGNVALNSLSNVYAPLMVAADEQSQQVVPILNPSIENNFGALGLKDQDWGGGDAVPVNTVDSFELRRCRLMIVDVEGMEIDVLRGAEATLATCAPVLYVANHRQDKSPALIAHLLDRGYQLYWNLEPVWRAENFAGTDRNDFADTIVVGMVCLPPGDATRIDGRRITSPADRWNGDAPIRTFVP